MVTILKLLKGSLYTLLLSTFVFSCIPIRKQLLLSDKNRKTLKEKQKMDTTVAVPDYFYKIRKGDILGVEITSITPGEYRLDAAAQGGGNVKSTEREAGYLVNDTGYVDIPVIGLVKAEGYSTEQCRQNIKALASEYLNNVSVNLKLISFEVQILGEIQGPSTIRSADGKLTIIEAVALARGVAEFANIQKVKIIRQADGDRKLHVFYADISNLDIVSRPEYYLQPNDIIIIEPSRLKNFNQNVRSNVSLVLTGFSAILLMYNLYNTFSK